MMLLIAMAITVAYGASMATSLGWFDLDFWWELGAAGHHHAARPLAGDEGPRPGPGRARRPRRTAARRGRAGRPRRPGPRPCPSTTCGVGDVVLVRSGARVPADGDDRRRQRRARRVDDHRRVAVRSPRPPGTGSSPAPSSPTRRSGCGSTRSATTPRWPASSAWSPKPRSPARGPRSLADRAAALLFYVATGAAVVTAVVWTGARRRRRSRRARRHGAGHLLPARPRPGHPAGDLAVVGARGPQRHPDQGPPGARGEPHRRRGPVRQDRHAHQGRARGRRRRRRRASTRTRSSALAGGVEVRQRAPAGPGHRGRRRTSGAASRAATDFRSITGRGVEATVDGDASTPSAGRRCCGSATLDEPAELGRLATAGRPGAPPSSTSSANDEIVGALALEDEIRPEARAGGPTAPGAWADGS